MLTSAKLRGSQYDEGKFYETTYVYLRTNIQVSRIILTRFKQRDSFTTPSPLKTNSL